MTATSTVGMMDNGNQGLPTTASQWTSTEDDCTELQSLDQWTSTGSMDNHVGSQSLDHGSLGQRTAGAGRQSSTTVMHTQGTIMEDSQATPHSLDQRFTDKDR